MQKFRSHSPANLHRQQDWTSISMGKKRKKRKKKAFINHTSWPNIKWDIKRMTTTLQTMEPFQS